MPTRSAHLKKFGFTFKSGYRRPSRPGKFNITVHYYLFVFFSRKVFGLSPSRCVSSNIRIIGCPSKGLLRNVPRRRLRPMKRNLVVGHFYFLDGTKMIASKEMDKKVNGSVAEWYLKSVANRFANWISVLKRKIEVLIEFRLIGAKSILIFQSRYWKMYIMLV